MQEQRRRHPRFRDTVMITYEDVSSGQDCDVMNELPCWLKEISEGGAMLQSPKQIPSGTRLVLHVNLLTEDGREVYLKVDGQARWDKQASDGGPWYIGVQFEPLGDEETGLLKHYIETRFSSVSSADPDNALFE